MSYVNYLMPGIIAMTAIFGALTTDPALIVPARHLVLALAGMLRPLHRELPRPIRRVAHDLTYNGHGYLSVHAAPRDRCRAGQCKGVGE